MNIALFFREGPGCLGVEASGEWTTSDAIQAIETIRAEADRRGLTRLLVDMRKLSEPHSEMTRYFTGEHIAKAWPHPFRTAVVLKREIYNRFAENTAKNRGAQVSVFFEEEAALDWLLKEDPRPNPGGVGRPFL
jgi:hypothetical protein